MNPEEVAEIAQDLEHLSAEIETIERLAEPVPGFDRRLSVEFLPSQQRGYVFAPNGDLEVLCTGRWQDSNSGAANALHRALGRPGLLDGDTAGFRQALAGQPGLADRYIEAATRFRDIFDQPRPVIAPGDMEAIAAFRKALMLTPQHLVNSSDRYETSFLLNDALQSARLRNENWADTVIESPATGAGLEDVLEHVRQRRQDAGLSPHSDDIPARVNRIWLGGEMKELGEALDTAVQLKRAGFTQTLTVDNVQNTLVGPARSLFPAATGADVPVGFEDEMEGNSREVWTRLMLRASGIEVRTIDDLLREPAKRCAALEGQIAVAQDNNPAAQISADSDQHRRLRRELNHWKFLNELSKGVERVYTHERYGPLQNFAGASDTVRYFGLLVDKGGWYLDADVRLQKEGSLQNDGPPRKDGAEALKDVRVKHGFGAFVENKAGHNDDPSVNRNFNNNILAVPAGHCETMIQCCLIPVIAHKVHGNYPGYSPWTDQEPGEKPGQKPFLYWQPKRTHKEGYKDINEALQAGLNKEQFGERFWITVATTGPQVVRVALNARAQLSNPQNPERFRLDECIFSRESFSLTAPGDASWAFRKKLTDLPVATVPAPGYSAGPGVAPIDSSSHRSIARDVEQFNYAARRDGIFATAVTGALGRQYGDNVRPDLLAAYLGEGTGGRCAQLYDTLTADRNGFAAVVNEGLAHFARQSGQEVLTERAQTALGNLVAVQRNNIERELVDSHVRQLSLPQRAQFLTASQGRPEAALELIYQQAPGRVERRHVNEWRRHYVTQRCDNIKPQLASNVAESERLNNALKTLINANGGKRLLGDWLLQSDKQFTASVRDAVRDRVNMSQPSRGRGSGQKR